MGVWTSPPRINVLRACSANRTKAASPQHVPTKSAQSATHAVMQMQFRCVSPIPEVVQDGARVSAAITMRRVKTDDAKHDAQIHVRPVNVDVEQIRWLNSANCRLDAPPGKENESVQIIKPVSRAVPVENVCPGKQSGSLVVIAVNKAACAMPVFGRIGLVARIKVYVHKMLSEPVATVASSGAPLSVSGPPARMRASARRGV